MLCKKTIVLSLVISCLFLSEGLVFGGNSEASEMEGREYKQEWARIKAMRESLRNEPRSTNDLAKYEDFADQIQSKWKQKDKEHYARLMLEICAPLSSGDFGGCRPYDLAREYALWALADANEIPVFLELELTGHVQTDMYSRNAPKGEDFAQRRRKDVAIRVHAWKRLTDAIDPNWDPNDMPYINVPLPPGAPIPAEISFVSGMSPAYIKDPELRAAYEEAVEKNRQKAERSIKQSRLRKWLERFPRHAEPYIIRAYSRPPFNLEELKGYLNKYLEDSATRNKILEAVETNMAKEAKTEQDK